jgi:hypothetical protein
VFCSCSDLLFLLSLLLLLFVSLVLHFSASVNLMLTKVFCCCAALCSFFCICSFSVLLQFNVTCLLLKLFFVWVCVLGFIYLERWRDWSISFDTGLQLQRAYICL